MYGLCEMSYMCVMWVAAADLFLFCCCCFFLCSLALTPRKEVAIVLGFWTQRRQQQLMSLFAPASRLSLGVPRSLASLARSLAPRLGSGGRGPIIHTTAARGDVPPVGVRCLLLSCVCDL
jgi:hypothetical protein